jgi:hypothetical protein
VRYRAAASHTRARAAPDTATPRDTLSLQYKIDKFYYFLEIFLCYSPCSHIPLAAANGAAPRCLPLTLYSQCRHVPISPHS